MFFGAKSGDVQPDWVDLNKVQIPQADEQQRLLVNLIEQMNLDKKPLPKFWYFPRGEKAVVVMTGDDHASGGTSGQFDWAKSARPANCNVADWDCIRQTSYIYPRHTAVGQRGGCLRGAGLRDRAACQHELRELDARASLEGFYANQLAQFAAAYPSVAAPPTNRTHCITWSDWATQPKVELESQHPARHELLLLARCMGPEPTRLVHRIRACPCGSPTSTGR